MQTGSLLLSAFLCTLCGPLAAQQLIEPFTYPDGPTIPGWTQQRGIFALANQRVVYQGGALWGYLTRDGLNPKNSVIDVEVLYGPGAGLRFAGLTSRHPGTNLDSNLVMCKVQDNGGAADYDILYIYERGVGALLSQAIPTPTVNPIIRMITLDSSAIMQIDGNKDGVFELTSTAKVLTTILGTGLVGVSGYQTIELDNFKYFDAVLVESTPPQIGTTYRLRMATSAAQNTVWVAALSTGNTGIPLLGNRAIPLTNDPLFQISAGNAAALGLSGLIDVNGDGNLALPIPNNLALVGFAMYCAGITFDPAKPMGIGAISQDHRIVIQ